MAVFKKNRILPAALTAALLLTACNMPGDTELVHAESDEFPVEPFAMKNDVPGGVNSPQTWQFWARDRSSSAAADLNSYYQTEAVLLAQSTHFVIYVEKSRLSLITVAEAENLLTELETGYNRMNSLYAGNLAPFADRGHRTVLLAMNIKDDYGSGNPVYIAGYFAPRDLYSDEFTRKLYTDFATIAKTDTETVLNLRGRSNENAIVYVDLNPAFTGAAHGGDTEKARDLLTDTVTTELSHLFSYYRRRTVERQAMHDTWLAEGFAEISPYLSRNSTNILQDRLRQHASPSILAQLSQGPSLIDWPEGGQLAGYIQAGLFFYYATHRLNAEETGFQNFLTVENEKAAGFESALLDPEGLSFSTVFRDFTLANYLYQSGRSLDSVTDESGTTEAAGSLSDKSSWAYRLSYADAPVEKKGETGAAFRNQTLPFAYELPSCLEPGSAVVFRHTYNSTDLTSFTPTARGMHDSLKLVVNSHDEINTSSAAFTFFAADDTIDMSTSGLNFTNGNIYHFIVMNTATSGECLSTGNLPADERNLGSWVGASKNSWQTGVGAAWGNNAKQFYRPSGVALHLKGPHGGSDNYVYVADYINMSVSRYNLDTGAFAGRLGSTSTTCPAEDNGWDASNGRYVNNYCQTSFNEPRGLTLDSNANLYIADTGNHVIKKYDENGSFLAWLGDSGNDTYRTTAGKPATDLKAGCNYEECTDMFYLPWDVEIVEDGGTDYMYVVNYGSSRISRRKLSDGSFAGFVGNGQSAWSTTATQSGHRSDVKFYFNRPQGITSDGTYLYIIDSSNHRLVRMSLDGLTTFDWVGGGAGGWHTDPTPAGNGDLEFSFPADVEYHDNYLYVTDRQNQRIMKIKSNGTYAGWVGGGQITYNTTDKAPEEDPLLSGTEYLPEFFLQPLFIAIGDKSETGSTHTYMYTTAIYNGRLLRLNHDCYEDPIGGCTGD